MNLEKIVSILGKPGLYNVISQTKGGVIVESLTDKKRVPVNSMHTMSALNDIAIYTYDEEVSLREVFLKISKKEDSKTAIDPKSSKNDLTDYFSEILPNYDVERVYPSNIKKVIQWYNSLVDVGFDFSTLEEVEEENEESNKD